MEPCFFCGFIYYSRLSAHYAKSQIMNFYHGVLVVCPSIFSSETGKTELVLSGSSIFVFLALLNQRVIWPIAIN